MHKCLPRGNGMQASKFRLQKRLTLFLIIQSFSVQHFMLGEKRKSEIRRNI